MQVRLTGPYEGRTMVLLNVKFVNGLADLPGGYQFKSLQRYYKVEEVNGKRNLQAEEAERTREKVPVPGGVQPFGEGAAKASSDDQRADDDRRHGTARSVPGGDGHSDAGLHESSGLDEVGAAVKQLDPRDSRLWTKEGRPRAGALSKVLGRRITRAEINQKIEVGIRQEVLP